MTARVRAFVLGLCLLPSLAATALPRPCFAQEDPAITAEARKRFLEGVKLFDEKKYELARAAFVQAYALKKHPDVLLNLAQSELLSGHYFEAVQHFKDFLKDPTTASHPKRGEAQRGLDDARAHTGRLQVTVDAPDADVLLDGKKVGTSPLAEPIDVPPGPHVVEAVKGDKRGKEGVLATEGKIVITSLSIAGGTPPPPPPIPGKEEPKAGPKEEPKAAPKEEPREEPAAAHEEAPAGGRREGFGHWATHSPVAFAGAGLVAIGLGTTIAFAIAGNSADSNKTNLTNTIKAHAATDPDLIASGRTANPCADPIPSGYTKACSNLKDNIDAENTDKTLTTVGIVVTAAGVVTLVGGYFLTAKTSTDEASGKPPARRFMIGPVAGPQLTGVGAIGTF